MGELYTLRIVRKERTEELLKKYWPEASFVVM